MSAINSVHLVGYLGADAEILDSKNGKGKPQKIARFSIGDNSLSFKDTNGNHQDRHQWHRVVIFGNPNYIDSIGKYLSKGKLVAVEGYLKNSKFTDKNNITRFTTDVAVDNKRGDIKLLGSSNRYKDKQPTGSGSLDAKDIPF